MTITEIKLAIESLPGDEQAQLAEWIADRDSAAWDAEMERDFSPGGRGAKLLQEVDEQIQRGEARPLSEGPPKR